MSDCQSNDLDQINNNFNLHIVYDNFQISLLDNEDIHLKYYLNSFGELIKFFNILGSLFTYVSDELQSKIKILEAFINDNEIGKNFETVKKMIEYEKNEKLLNKSDYVSGSRTLLRLHRGLDFIREFLRKIYEIKDDDSTSIVCREAYNHTLANYHSFIIRTVAKVSMSSMPTRKQLLNTVFCENDEEINRNLSILPLTLDITSNVFEKIENIYSIYDLHNLP